MTASPPDSPSGEVWTSEPFDYGSGYYHFKNPKNDSHRYIGPNGLRDQVEKGNALRSVLPIPSAERIAALEALAKAAAIESYNEHEPRCACNQCVALERLKATGYSATNDGAVTPPPV